MSGVVDVIPSEAFLGDVIWGISIYVNSILKCTWIEDTRILIDVGQQSDGVYLD
jgi:hypothetical protein